MPTTETNIVQEFKEILKSKHSDIASLYHHIFSIMSDEHLSETLEYYKTVYQEDKESWFYYFHKSMRQTDFFGNDVLSYRIVNMLTDEQKARREELLKIREKQYKKFKKKNKDENYEKYKEFRKLPECVEVLTELQKLNEIMNTKEETRISGHLDMILWNTIHVDKNNELQSILERTFKICS